MMAWGKNRVGTGGWLAVGLESDRIDLVRGGPRDKQPPRIAEAASYAAGGDRLNALKRLRKSRGLGTARCIALMPPGQYHFLQVDEPNVPAEELKEAVRWQVKDLVDFPVDEATLDILPIPAAGGRGGQLFVVLAPNHHLVRTIQEFQEAGLQLEVVDVPETAQRNVAALFEDENRGLAFLHFDTHGGLLTFTFRGELYGVRRIDIQAEQIAQADGERREQLFERIGLELQRSLDNFERLFTAIPLSRLVLAPCPQQEALVAYLQNLVFVPLQVADLSQAMDFAAVPELREGALQGARLSLLGAVLREGKA